MPRVGCLSKAARRVPAEPESPHYTRDALLAGSRPSAPEGAPNTRRAVTAAVLVKDLFGLGSEHSIVCRARARLGVQPLVVGAARDLKYATSSSRRDPNHSIVPSKFAGIPPGPDEVDAQKYSPRVRNLLTVPARLSLASMQLGFTNGTQ